MLKRISLLTFIMVFIVANMFGIGAAQAATQPVGKTPYNGNPLISHKFGADPFAMTYNGRVYVYLTNDILEYDSNGNVIDNSYSKINKITVISSDDLVNWTDHGEIPVAGSQGAAKWANNSWAPAAAHKTINGKEKFFLYFANNASSIGVLTSDSPIGPWTDPLGKSLIDRSVPGASDVTWLFDPAVLVDSDGTGYLYFGGGVPTGQDAHPKTARVIKLGNDMTSVVGSAVTIDAPYFFEDSGIHKYNGKYYYSYCSNFYSGTRPSGSPGAGQIAYMVSDNPMGPFTYVKTILKNPYDYFGVGGNNHHSIFDFNGQWYITYHAQTLAKAMGVAKGYRSPHINQVFYNSSGVIQDVQANLQGAAQLKNLNPYTRVEAETIGWQGGIQTESTTQPGGMVSSINLDAAYINNDDWIALSNVDFGSAGASTFTANVSSATNGGTIELRLDSLTGSVIGTLSVPSTGSWTSWTMRTTNVSGATGVHDVYMIFKGSTGYLFNVDYWQFATNSTPTGASSLQAVANSNYVAAESAGANPLVANRTSVGSWEKFVIVDNADGTVSLRASVNNQYVSVDVNQQAKLIAKSQTIGSAEKFYKITNTDGTVSFRAAVNNKYVCADLLLESPFLVADRDAIGQWEKFIVSPAP